MINDKFFRLNKIRKIVDNLYCSTNASKSDMQKDFKVGLIIGLFLDVSLVDEVIEVTDEDAIATTRQLGCEFGLLVGISSGANVWAARELAKKYKGNITTVLPDRAERYFSTSLL
jgi:cysteine synthase